MARRLLPAGTLIERARARERERESETDRETQRERQRKTKPAIQSSDHGFHAFSICYAPDPQN